MKQLLLLLLLVLTISCNSNDLIDDQIINKQSLKGREYVSDTLYASTNGIDYKTVFNLRFDTDINGTIYQRFYYIGLDGKPTSHRYSSIFNYELDEYEYNMMLRDTWFKDPIIYGNFTPGKECLYNPNIRLHRINM